MTEVYYKGRRFKSMSELAARIGVHRSNVSRACKHREMIRGAYVIPLERLAKERDAR